jgi:hypothetical protein
MINDAVARMEGSLQELEFVVFWSRGYRVNDMLAIALHSTSKLMLQPAPLHVRSSKRDSLKSAKERSERRRSSMWVNGG